METKIAFAFCVVVSLTLIFSLLVKLLNLYKENTELKQKNEEIKIQNLLKMDELMIYQMFTGSIPVKRFFSTLENIDPIVFNTDIKFVLMKYFRKVFINLDSAHIPMLISNIKANKQSAILTEAFIEALEREENLIGNALFYAAKECDNDSIRIVDSFLDELRPEVKKEQIKVAINLLQDYLTNSLDDIVLSDYYREVVSNLRGLQIMVEPLR